MPCVLPLKRLPRLIALLGAAALTSRAQEPVAQQNDLQKQVELLKQQYEQTTREMQQRISTLEQQIAEQKANSEKAKQGTVSSVELAAGQAAQKALGQSDQVGAKYQGQLSSEPTYDLLNEAESKISRLQEQLGAFEFHGYFRSGYGLNSKGGAQVAFEAPGADAKYRLGNEAETYGEFIFVNNWLNPEPDSDRAWMKTEIMLEANTTNSTSYAAFPQPIVNGQATSGGNDQFRLREAFVRGGHVFGDSQTGATFRAGERYYRRQHID